MIFKFQNPFFWTSPFNLHIGDFRSSNDATSCCVEYGRNLRHNKLLRRIWEEFMSQQVVATNMGGIHDKSCAVEYLWEIRWHNL